MKRPVLLAASALLLLGLVACASVEPIPYSPDTSTVKDAPAEIRALIVANTIDGCVSDPEVSEKILTVQFVCTNGAGNSTVRFDRVKEIKLAKSGDWFRCIVVHEEGAEEWHWDSKSKRDMEELANAIAVMAAQARAPVAEPAGETPEAI